MDAQAISQILSVPKSLVEKDFETFGVTGKEQLNDIFKKYSGKKATPLVKGLIGRAMKKIPKEISEILREIKVESTKIDQAIERYEEF